MENIAMQILDTFSNRYNEMLPTIAERLLISGLDQEQTEAIVSSLTDVFTTSLEMTIESIQKIEEAYIINMDSNTSVED